MAIIAVRAVDPQGGSRRATSRSREPAQRVDRAMALDTFAKGEADAPTTINGWTIEQDADDPAVFAALLGEG
jgi:hypothetical protein